MEITLKVVLSADANFLSALQTLFPVVVTGTPVTLNGSEEKTTRTRKPKEEKVTSDNAPLTLTVQTEETKVQGTEHTLESIRAIAVPLSKKSDANKNAIIAKVKELGYEKLPELQPQHFQTMFDYLQTLS